MRLNKPIPIFLLLWPTLWALWLANQGKPENKILLIFIAGVILMRSVGCIINDFADRHLDGYVRRTANRPLATQQVSVTEALILAGFLMSAAFVLVLFCNALTIQLAFIGAGLAVIYPFLKRWTHLPQLGLGLAFAWSVPMAFAASLGNVNASAWFLFATVLIWPVIYDTQYAMVDREDDRVVGIKSSAILFGRNDRLIIAILQCLFIFLLMLMGFIFHLSVIYDFSLVMAAALFLYQQWLIKDRKGAHCLIAFLNNHWIGFIIFLGIILGVR